MARKGSNHEPCRFDCGREVTRYTGAGVCDACYRWLWEWSGRTPSEILQRADQLRVIQARMDTISNVRPIKRAKRRRA